MSYIYTPTGGCVTTKNMVKGSAPPVGFVAQLNPGVYSKIETNQIVSPGVNTHFPTDPLTAGCVVKQLKDRIWYKGILVEFNWAFRNPTGSTYDWTFTDKLFADVLANAPTKRIMVLLPFKIFDVTEADQILPADLRTTNGKYSDTTTNKYHYLWCYTQGTAPAPVIAKGYHLNLYQFQDGLTGNDQAGLPIYTLRDRYYAFLQAISDRYGVGTAYENIFAGVMTTESASLNQKDSFVGANNVTAHFKGRVALLKKLKQIFPKHMVMEDCNFNNDWTDLMTSTGAVNAIGNNLTDGLIANGITFTQSNYHTGTNMYGWTNIHLLYGKIPIIAQAQGLDLDSKSGERPKFYDYPNSPVAGWPDSSVIITEDTVAPYPSTQQPPDMAWIIDRAKHFQSTHLIVQHNKSHGLNKYGVARYNWDDFASDMDASGHATDVLGGLDTINPDNIV